MQNYYVILNVFPLIKNNNLFTLNQIHFTQKNAKPIHKITHNPNTNLKEI